MITDKSNADWSRRNFLLRIAKAGTAVCSVGLIGYLFYDPKGPLIARKAEDGIVLPDFSVSGQSGRLCIARGTNRIDTIQKALNRLGGIETFIQKGDRVLLKVNAAFASPPALSATTHPDLVSEVTRLCRKAGAEFVKVTDNPINDPASCFMLSGIEEAARLSGAQVIFPRKDYFRNYTVTGGRLIVNWPLLYEPLKGINKVIGMAPLKDHHRSGASMSMKNWYGLLGGGRNIFHQDIHNIIKELAMMIRPTLVILDGTTALMTNGPTGGSLADVAQTNTMIVSTDQVAADTFGATLLNRQPSELAFLAKAQEAGVGTMDYRSLKPEVIN